MNKEIYLLGLTIKSYYLFIGIGFLSFLFLSFYRRKKYNFSIKQYLLICFIVVLSALFGGKLYAIIAHTVKYNTSLTFVSGFKIFGGIISVTIFVYLFSIIIKDKKFAYFDLIAPGCCLILAFSKLGCFMEGCCDGIECSWWFATPYEQVIKFPIQLLESIITFISFFLLLIIEKKGKYPGYLFVFFMLFYCYERFFCDFLRDEYYHGNMISTTQIISLIYIIGSLILIINKIKKISRKKYNN